MNLKKVMILRDVVDILSDNEMKATRGGYGYSDYNASNPKVCKGPPGIWGECICGAYCSTDSQCVGWYGAGSKCSCSYC
jgi:hypothetical protein